MEVNTQATAQKITTPDIQQAEATSPPAEGFGADFEQTRNVAEAEGGTVMADSKIDRSAELRDALLSQYGSSGETGQSSGVLRSSRMASPSSTEDEPLPEEMESEITRVFEELLGVPKFEREAAWRAMCEENTDDAEMVRILDIVRARLAEHELI
ncbi:hypothetical protein [Pandoraea commovens]|uniref:Uncharacterized protein n=1 Tax=Pandoraea commovens TaxID=2508289 RepID=A0A5E4WXH7_9BURK|nr:hypothetical protein [Pandoraea commovens]VVE28450.1 hypothetical protein PCO31010_03545 [Pandoraea commovens]